MPEKPAATGLPGSLGPGLGLPSFFPSLLAVSGDWSAHQLCHVHCPLLADTTKAAGAGVSRCRRAKGVVTGLHRLGGQGLVSGAHMLLIMLWIHWSAGHNQQTIVRPPCKGPRQHTRTSSEAARLRPSVVSHVCDIIDKHHEPVHAGSKGIAAYLDYSLLYPLRHPDFLRKSCSGGLPYGALGREGISSRERGRVVGVIRVAEPGATHSQVSFSLFPWALSERLQAACPPAGPVARRDGRKWSRPVPSTPHNSTYRC